MEDFRVPKRRVEIETLSVDGVSRKIGVYLSEYSAIHSGSERVSDLLNEVAEFFPAIDGQTGQTIFLTRSGLISATVASVEELDASERDVPLTEQRVEVTLTNGTTFQGTMAYLRHPERSRVIDVLNEPSRFFSVRVGDRTTLINKRHVVVAGFVA